MKVNFGKRRENRALKKAQKKQDFTCVADVSCSEKGYSMIAVLAIIAILTFTFLEIFIWYSNKYFERDVTSKLEKYNQMDIEEYVNEINEGKVRLKIVGNCKSIDYSPPLEWDTEDKLCHLFHSDGGAVTHRHFKNFCPSEEVLGTLAIGERCGNVVYAGMIDESRLYTTAEDQGSFAWNISSSDWSNTGATSVSDGKLNTDKLVRLAVAGTPYGAAQACRKLGPQWYLPAKNELSVMQKHRHAIGGFNDIGSFPLGFYSASTEINNVNMWVMRFSHGSASAGNKIYKFSVRCVRR